MIYELDAPVDIPTIFFVCIPEQYFKPLIFNIYSGDAVYSSLTRPSSPSPMTYRMASHSAAPTYYAPSYSSAPKRMVSYGDTGGYTTNTRPAQTSGSTRVVYDSGPRSYGGGIYDFGYGPRFSTERRW